MISLKLIWKAFVRGKWWMLIGVFIILIVSIGFVISTEDNYKSSWTVLIPSSGRVSRINLDQIGEAVSNSSSAYNNISVNPKTTYREIALSTAVVNQAAEHLGMKPDEFGAPKIKLVDQTSAMVFSIKAESAELAQKKGNIFYQVFQETLDKLRQDELTRQHDGMIVQLGHAKKTLTNARQQILKHQSNNAVVSVEQFEEMALNTERIRFKHTDIESEFNRIHGFNRSLSLSMAITPEQAGEIIRLQSDQTINAILSRRAELDTEITTNRGKLAKKHPKMQKLLHESTSLQQHLLREVSARAPALADINPTLVFPMLREDARDSVEKLIHTVASQDGLQQQADSLKSKLGEYENRLSKHSKDVAKLADLKRDHQIAEAIFSSALAKIDTGKLDIYATYPLTQSLTQPSLPTRAIRIYKFIVFAAAALSILIYITGILLICLRQEYKLNT